MKAKIERNVMDDIVNAALRTAECIRVCSLELAKSELESALVLAKCYGEFLRYNYIGVLADIAFEEQFVQRFSFLADGLTNNTEFDTLHLMTTAYVYGGHTRAVERFLSGGLGDGLATLDKLPKQVSDKIPCNVQIYDGLRQQSGVATIKKILEIASRFKFVILHIHPEDIYSAIAAGLLAKLGVKVYLYNHADHGFSFGYFAAEKVLEISKYGWVRGAKRGIEHKQTFVGIPIPIWERKQERSIDGVPTIRGLFAGSAGKFFPWSSFSAPEFLNQWFHSSDNSKKVEFIICGPTGREGYWRILDSIAADKVVFLGAVPHVEYVNLLSTCDFYVDSFPQGNGTGFVEAVMLGIPSFGMDLLAGSSPADVLRSSSVPELIDRLNWFIADKKAV
ncbi:MAG: hypothetical protein QXP01_02260, partial [Candidatus Hadarchaeum sp.]